MSVNREIELEANGCALDKRRMTLGRRIDERRSALGISQAELARRVGLRQSTINSLINGDSRSSRKIVQLARELATTPAYLTGEIDDPDNGAAAPPPDPTHHHILLPVAWPTEAALTRMFLGLILPFELENPDLLARTLARQLPKGFRQLQGRLIESPVADRELEDAEALANDLPAPRRARRT